MGRGAALAALCVSSVWSCGGTVACGSSEPEPEVVRSLDVQRYAGTWFEIASLPVSQQEGCVDTRATYDLEADGRFTVKNVCRDAESGELREAEGVAWIADADTPAKLKVRFFWPFRADYWVLELDPDYEWVLVGTPDREHAWILSRNPRLDEEILGRLVDRLQRDDYPVDRLQRTIHPSG